MTKTTNTKNDDRAAIRAEIERRLAQPLPEGAAQLLHKEHPALTAPQNGAELVAVLRDGGEGDLLETFVSGFRRATPTAPAAWDLFFLLLAAFEKPLDGIYKKRLRLAADRGYGDDAWKNETWAVVLNAFRDALATCPLSAPTMTLDKIVANHTLKNVLRWTLAERKQATARRSFELRALPLIEPARPDADDGTETGAAAPGATGLYDFSRPHRKKERPAPAPGELATAAEHLRLFVDAGVISAATRDLLVEHHARGTSLADLAHAHGMKLDTLAKRLQRARTRIRAHARHLSRARATAKPAARTDTTTSSQNNTSPFSPNPEMKG